MYKIVATTRFKKDLKLIIKRGYNLALMDEVITALAEERPLQQKNHDHLLQGNYDGCR